NEFILPKDGAWLVTILAPSTLPETVTLRRAEASGGTFRTHQDGGFDVIVAAGKSVQVPLIGGGAYHLYASSATGGARAFTVDIAML
ncbi:MAG: hypothetical protein ABFD96_23765, partial [Armatimonadia bacterium]